MSSKVFIGIIAVLILGAVGFVAVKQKNAPPEPPRPGTEQPEMGNKHISPTGLPNSGGMPPTSGDMTDPVPCRAYDQEIPDASTIHNMEHGSVYISYRPDLPPEQLARMRSIFFQPFLRSDFTPNKALMAPRTANESQIVISSWRRSEKFAFFDEEKMIQYYLRNVSKSPEGTAKCQT